MQGAFAGLLMADHAKIKEIVARVVGQVLESHIPHLREELVRRVLEDMPASAPASENGAGSQALLDSMVAIQKGTAQKEILKQLLEQSNGYCGRSALFIVKAGTVQGWQAQGFGNNDRVKNFTLQATADLVKRVVESREPASGSVAQMGDQFASTFDAPSDGDCFLLPLILKEKVAALLYADAGSELAGVLDQAALELMVRTTGQWLEVLTLRKSPMPAGADAPAVEAAVSAAEPVIETPAPAQTMAAAASAPHSTKAAPSAPTAPAPAPAPAAAARAAAPAPAAPDPNDIQAKAQRFARLLIDEIKLYNLAKVEEGRKHRDLYDRLKDDIEKSRTTYERRYSNTPAASGDYFYHELVRSLAQDDPSLLGKNYRR